MARARPSSPPDPLDRLVGEAPALQTLRAQIRHLARFDAVGHPAVPTVLLQGETGTGKGLVARIIHDSGPRAPGPFLEVNCAAIPETLLEAELFGFEAGAFTDAKRAKPGLFEAASGGTLFLDEIAALPLALQGKFLTAIEAKRVRRVGAVVEHPMDVKLIAATQVELSGHVEAGRFRADLYHRLAAVVLALPPLRERGDDILVLARAFLQQYGAAYGVGPQRLSKAAEAWLLGYRWPGNVRELSHLLERIVLLEAATVIDPESLERLCLPQPMPAVPVDSMLPPRSDMPLKETERMADALRQSGGNIAAAARLLGMSRGGLRYRLHKYGLTHPSVHRSSPLAGEDPRGGEPLQPFSSPTLTLPRRGGGETPAQIIRSQDASTGAEEPAAGWVMKPVAVLAIEASWAVIGHEIPLSLIQTIAEVTEETLHRGLAHIQAAEFLYETRLFPEQEYTFKHALTHEVAYGSLLLERRRVLHVRIVGALEALAPDRVAEQVERLAHHALRGEVWDKAGTYCQQAGARAHDRAALREAVAVFEQGLQALAHLPEPGDTRVLALELRVALGGELTRVGEYGRCLALLGEAEALARALENRARLGQVLVTMAQVLRMTGEPDGAMAAGQQALELATELSESALQEQASLRLGQAYYAIGDFGRAAELRRRNVGAGDRESGTLSTDMWIAASQTWLARTLSALGAFAEGRRYGEEALHLATLEGRGVTPITAHGCLGLLYLAQGDLEHAIRVLEQGLALCRASGYRGGWLRLIAAGLGYASTLQGRLAEGHALLEEWVREGIRTGAPQSPQQVAWLSEACRLAARGDEAWQYAR